MNKNALVFSPSFDGHRQVYAQHLIESLLRRGYVVHTVFDQSESNKSYPYLDVFTSNPFVSFEVVPNAEQTTLPEFRKLQDKLTADVTILLEADNHLEMLTRQYYPGYPRLRGKNIGIFVRSTNYVYFPKQPRTIWNMLRCIKHLPTTWKSDPRMFHEYSLPAFKLLDIALTLDEFYAESHSKTHKWLPDMVFPLLPDHPTLALSEGQRWNPQLTSFLRQNTGREALLYFGAARRRRGYDTLLKIACEDGCCFIHCGTSPVTEEYDDDVAEFKVNLASQNLLFETNEYVQSYDTVRLFFESCRYVVLPYRNHFGSSGVMLQAIHFGKPVLVPDQGLMAARTKQAHLGLTYRHDDYEDLRKQWRQLSKSSTTFFNTVSESKSAFSIENAEQTINTVLDQLDV